MFFKKTLQENEKVNDVNVILRVNGNREIQRQIQMIGLTLEDLKKIKSIQPFVIESLDFIVNDFYKNVEKESSLRAIISEHSSMDKLRNTLRHHISEMFAGSAISYPGAFGSQWISFYSDRTGL